MASLGISALVALNDPLQVSFLLNHCDGKAYDYAVIIRKATVGPKKLPSFLVWMGSKYPFYSERMTKKLTSFLCV